MRKDQQPKGNGWRRLGATALWLSIAGVTLALGACGPDRPSGKSNYPENWEFRQGPSDNHGKIYRY